MPFWTPPPVLLAVVGFGILTAVGARIQRVQRRVFYRQVAADLGLRWHPLGFWRLETTVMSGSIEGFAVVAENFYRQERETLRVTIDSTGRAAGAIPPTLHLVRQVAGISIFGGEDVITGDTAFDEAVRVGGGASTALAVLDATARRAFLETLGRLQEVRVAEGRVSGGIDIDAAEEPLVAVVRSVVALAASLALPPGGVEAALARRAAEDPLPGVRLHAFEAIEHRPGDLGVRDDDRPARRLLADPHPELRLRAAMRLGAEGFEVLAGIVRTPPPKEQPARDGRLWWELRLPDGATPPDEALFETAAAHELRRARALRHLAGLAPRDLVLPLVAEALRGPGPLRAAALEAAGKIGEPSLEPEAIDALGSRDPGVRRAAVDALGAVGTAAAVPALRALAGGGFADRALRRSAEQAIARIQSRLPGAGAGQVALAGGPDAAGRVSLAPAPDAGGRVALAPDEDGG